MELYIAGGCGEHGRNCFVVQGQSHRIAVDCGVKEGEDSPYPYLSQEEIKSIDYLCLTHSHKDHVGALHWFYKQGFEGTVILTAPTYRQMNSKPKNYILLDQKVGVKEEYPLEPGLTVAYGKSGHCAGSVWYLFHMEGHSLLFSGDYIETSNVYPCDRFVDVEVDLAVLDCAYQQDVVRWKEHEERVLQYIGECIEEKKKVILPVPKYGRSLDLLYHVVKKYTECPIYVDEQLNSYMDSADWNPWMNTNVYHSCKNIPMGSKEQLYDIEGPFIWFLSDPQLKDTNNQIACTKIAKEGGVILFTGNLDKGSYSKVMCENTLATFMRYPVHMSFMDVEEVVKRNTFHQIVLSHCNHPESWGELEPAYHVLSPKEYSVVQGAVAQPVI